MPKYSPNCLPLLPVKSLNAFINFADTAMLQQQAIFLFKVLLVLFVGICGYMCIYKHCIMFAVFLTEAQTKP